VVWGVAAYAAPAPAMSGSPPAPASFDTLNLQVKIHPGAPAVVEISGEIDITSAAWLRETLLLAIRRHGPAIRTDLRGVTFLDCSGVNVLLATARRAWLEGGWLRVVRPSAQAWRVITLLSLQDVLTRDDERAEPGTIPPRWPTRSWA
jgi:anti-anti-sigma factor